MSTKWHSIVKFSHKIQREHFNILWCPQKMQTSRLLLLLMRLHLKAASASTSCVPHYISTPMTLRQIPYRLWWIMWLGHWFAMLTPPVTRFCIKSVRVGKEDVKIQSSFLLVGCATTSFYSSPCIKHNVGLGLTDLPHLICDFLSFFCS